MYSHSQGRSTHEEHRELSGFPSKGLRTELAQFFVDSPARGKMGVGEPGTCKLWLRKGFGGGELYGKLVRRIAPEADIYLHHPQEKQG